MRGRVTGVRLDVAAAGEGSNYAPDAWRSPTRADSSAGALSTTELSPRRRRSGQHSDQHRPLDRMLARPPVIRTFDEPRAVKVDIGPGAPARTWGSITR